MLICRNSFGKRDALSPRISGDEAGRISRGNGESIKLAHKDFLFLSFFSECKEVCNKTKSESSESPQQILVRLLNHHVV